MLRTVKYTYVTAVFLCVYVAIPHMIVIQFGMHYNHNHIHMFAPIAAPKGDNGQTSSAANPGNFRNFVAVDLMLCAAASLSSSSSALFVILFALKLPIFLTHFSLRYFCPLRFRRTQQLRLFHVQSALPVRLAPRATRSARTWRQNLRRSYGC